ncbi:hypothetical protein HK105_207550 [Polyrhizophydium stewartii]|uniref:Uncharacterized protein n=1 Tax=Polyrhizophydium stewartii TaxID=2732419 RepID=A0ABR4N0D2_9FUNG
MCLDDPVLATLPTLAFRLADHEIYDDLTQFRKAQNSSARKTTQTSKPRK